MTSAAEAAVGPEAGFEAATPMAHEGCTSCNGSCGGDEGCGDCDWMCGSCSPGGRFWFRGDYLMWWGKSSTLPPLITTSPTGTPRNQAAVLLQPNTSILFGGEDLDAGLRSGARFTLGMWLDDCQDIGFEAVYLFLGNKATEFDATSDENAIMGRPFYNVQTPAQDALLLAYPNQQTGSIRVRQTSELESLEILMRQALVRQCNRRVDLLYGYRHGRFNEDLSIDGTTVYQTRVGTFPIGTSIQLMDQFETKNEFNGAEIGLASRTQYGRWSFELLSKLALGNNRTRVNINGSSVLTVPDQAPVTSPGGLLALPTNFQDYEKSQFAVIPELGMNVGYDLTERLRLTCGYTFLYFSQVARPSDQIDLNVNTSQALGGELSGIPAPEFHFISTDYWAQGLNFGLDYRY